WPQFVKEESGNPQISPADYEADPALESQIFGCDLWLEVTATSSPSGCDKRIDMMLVLDRSGSIDAGELAQLKTAAKAFVDAIAPTATGSHVGMVSFATFATLDQHLTDNATSTKAAIDALVAVGFTNLKDAIDLATGEFANPGDGHDRDDSIAPDKMVIITDGAPNRPLPSNTATTTAAIAADNARAAGIEIFVVGVGVSSSTEAYLKTDIADDENHYFAAANFEELQAILEDLATCP
ncbi:MAG: vWA domain-containing protein, partial [Candidatus Paceibacteria bacterium]